VRTYEAAKTLPIDGDYDVFGDGSVRILRMPGHTPGHQVLERVAPVQTTQGETRAGFPLSMSATHCAIERLPAARS
jgi:hypothetical protein